HQRYDAWERGPRGLARILHRQRAVPPRLRAGPPPAPVRGERRQEGLPLGSSPEYREPPRRLSRTLICILFVVVFVIAIISILDIIRRLLIQISSRWFPG